MRTIDRYLLWQFLSTFAICYVCLTGLYVVIDAFNNLDEFSNFASEHGGLPKLLLQYYGFRSLTFFNQISGILALVAAMFTVAWIQRHQELTALSAAGVSTLRVLAPVIGAACVIALISAANREYLVPKFRDEISGNAQDLSGDRGQDIVPRRDAQTDIQFRGAKLFVKEKRISKPVFALPLELEQNGKQLAAKEAHYRAATGDRPPGYLLSGVTEPKDLVAGPSLLIDGRPVILTPQDAPWLKPDECFVVSEVTFEMLAGGAAWRQSASTWELIRGLHSPSSDFGPEVRVTIHSRVVQPLLDMTLLLLGLPLAVSRSNRNVFLAIGWCLLLTTCFMGVVLCSHWVGENFLISPAHAVWAPLVVFVPLALTLADPLWK